MAFQKSFLRSTFAMVGIGVVAASIADPTVVSLIMLALTIPSILGAYYWSVNGGRPLSNQMATAIALLAFLISVAGAGAWLSVLLPFLHFLSASQCLRLWQEKKTREYVHLYVISVLQIACGASISLDIQFGLLFLIYLVIGFWTLILFYLRREVEGGAGFFLDDRRPVTVEKLDPATIRRSFKFGLVAMLVCLFVCTFALFLVLPRIHVRVINVRVPGNKAMVGFTKNIRLGEIGEIKDNAQVVMRARLIRNGESFRPAGDSLLWRGLALDDYDRGRWRVTSYKHLQIWGSDGEWNDHRNGRVIASAIGNQLQQPWPPVPNTTILKGNEILQEIALETTGSGVIFSLYPPIRYLLPVDAQAMSLELLHWNTRFDISTSKISYKVFSSPSAFVPSPIGPRYSRLSRMVFGRIPKNLLQDGRLIRLANQITQNSDSDTPVEKVTSIRRWLELNCKYTMLPGVTRNNPDDDPVLAFLFQTRKGHCEYFATAQVLLSRAVGVPARVVNGFRGGEWNELGEFYVVRQRHAHSWAEIFLSNEGWIPVDPSPLESEQRLLAGTEQLQKYYFFFQNLYDRAILQYNPRQTQLFSGLMGNALFDLKNDLLPTGGGFSLEGSEAIQSWIGQAALVLTLVAAAAGIFALIIRIARSSWGSRSAVGQGRAGHSPIAFYREMLLLLSKKLGREKEVAATPSEFAEDLISQHGTSLEPVRRVTQLYYGARFSGNHLSTGEEDEVRYLLGQLKSLPASRNKSLSHNG